MLQAVCAELCRVKEKYGFWELVDIQSADGEKLQITL